ncbi:CmcI family methyltransferase [Rheinheimera sp. KL1]|uniref:CmcI family methyltransferase n=1 Tax=Rheinheimera sp. KL1 TaxID=1635005 RepID=UPI0006A96C10|nr:CmcI family methyltransferase [Rheinheimera sp. KL1]
MLLEQDVDKRLLEVIQQRILGKTSWMGVKTLKNPMDFWVYQELIYESRPDYIVEIGNRFGGSTLALAHLCDLLGHGQVIGVDISHKDMHEKAKQHPRVTLIEGDACAKFAKVRSLIPINANVLVIEDSSHTFENTLNVVRLYSSLIPEHGYLIVEDSICHHGLDVGPSPGPYEAIEAFVTENTDFVIDRDKESFVITWNPKGFLKRLSL